MWLQSKLGLIEQSLGYLSECRSETTFDIYIYIYWNAAPDLDSDKYSELYFMINNSWICVK